MDFFCYHRDRADSLALRMELHEAHWSYMDGYAEQMIARGPVFTHGEDQALGSVHILTLPDPAAARAFAFEEPGYQAGMFRDVMVRRWRNELGRTMGEFGGGRPEEDGYLVLGLGGPVTLAEVVDVPKDPAGLIAYGPLLSDDGQSWLGTVALLRADSAEAARAVLDEARYAEVEVHGWEFGGRR